MRTQTHKIETQCSYIQKKHTKQKHNVAICKKHTKQKHNVAIYKVHTKYKTQCIYIQKAHKIETEQYTNLAIYNKHTKQKHSNNSYNFIQMSTTAYFTTDNHFSGVSAITHLCI